MCEESRKTFKSTKVTSQLNFEHKSQTTENLSTEKCNPRGPVNQHLLWQHLMLGLGFFRLGLGLKLGISTDKMDHGA